MSNAKNGCWLVKEKPYAISLQSSRKRTKTNTNNLQYGVESVVANDGAGATADADDGDAEPGGGNAASDSMGSPGASGSRSSVSSTLLKNDPKFVALNSKSVAHRRKSTCF